MLKNAGRAVRREIRLCQARHSSDKQKNIIEKDTTFTCTRRSEVPAVAVLVEFSLYLLGTLWVWWMLMYAPARTTSQSSLNPSPQPRERGEPEGRNLERFRGGPVDAPCERDRSHASKPSPAQSMKIKSDKRPMRALEELSSFLYSASHMKRSVAKQQAPETAFLRGGGAMSTATCARQLTG